MGIGRVIKSGCLGMLCLLPMAWISFQFLDLTSQITGGLIKNAGALTTAIGSLIGGGAGAILGFIIGAFMGLFLICIFPIHWALINNPNDIMLLIAIVLPWILCCTITAGLFAHSPRGGLNTSLAIGIGYMIFFVLIYIVLRLLLGPLGVIIDGLFTGLTDMPYILAVISATMEGAVVGGIFGAFIGSLKYVPEGTIESSKSKKSKSSKPEPTLDSFGSPSSSVKDEFCINCGAKFTGDDEFCTNCGAKRK
ncbi:MAG: zinc ribbon domain-containing protein [Promethearchaeota archaeon]